MTRWAMVADLNRCVGCQTCTIACKHANATPPGVQWRRVLDVEAGEFPDVRRSFVPVGCMHCSDAPCVSVCPSGATRQRDDGIVTIDYDRCIGCSYCAVACPYQARFKVERPTYAYGGRRMAHEQARGSPERIGVAQKCTFCFWRIDAGRAKGLTPGVDPEASPACVASCIADAIQFGDLDDPNSKVSRLLADNSHFRMHEELGTGPGLYYLYDRKPPATAAATPVAAAPVAVPSDEGLADVAPRLQTVWDHRAAANFMAGGTGSGLWVAAAIVDAGTGRLWPLFLLSLGLICAGLVSVWLEIGRPWRFLNVFRRVQTSWMTREAMVAVPLLAVGGAALLFVATPTGGVLTMVTAVLALLFLYCQARILAAAKGIPAWREPAVVPMIVSTGLAEGAGLVLAATAIEPGSTPFGSAAAALLGLLAVRAWWWRRYLRALRRGAPTRTLAAFDRLQPGFEIGAHLMPAILVASGWLMPVLAEPMFAVGGLLAFAGGWMLKHTLITKGAFNQGFAVTHMPARGAGTVGRGIKPGWTVQ